MPFGAQDERTFRKTMSKFPTGVTLLTTMASGRPRGVTASGFAALSAQPPLVLICAGSSLSLDRRDGFAVSVLAQHQHDAALRFAEGRRRQTGQVFDCVPWWPARVSGAPVLSGSVAWFDCTVHDLIETGQQPIIVGAVCDLGHVNGEPLLQVDGGYRGLEHPAPPPLLPGAGHGALLSFAAHP